MLSKDFLRQMRNQIQIIPLIVDVLQLSWHDRHGRFRFLCPACHDFDTAVNPATNLARCFSCQRNFNPIDLVMAVKHYSFRQAIDFLRPILIHIQALEVRQISCASHHPS